MAGSTASKQGNPFGESSDLQNRKDTLMTYLEDGHCSLSNNLSENAIRPFTVGRKNWLFSASRRELPLALLCIQWLRWQKRMT